MINNTLFSWHMFDEYSDLTRLTTVVETMELDDLVHEINLRRRGTRCEWPAKAMLTALIARSVYPHSSIESLRRELKRNPIVDAHLAGSSITAMGTTTSTTGCHQKVR